MRGGLKCWGWGGVGKESHRCGLQGIIRYPLRAESREEQRVQSLELFIFLVMVLVLHAYMISRSELQVLHAHRCLGYHLLHSSLSLGMVPVQSRGVESIPQRPAD